MYFRIAANPYPPDADEDLEPAALTHERDVLSTGFVRIWIGGERFAEPPQVPLRASIEPHERGYLLDFYQMPLCVMSRRLRDFFASAGVTSIDYYPVEILDVASGQVRNDFYAFNIVGLVAAADMANSTYSDIDDFVMFDKIAIHETEARKAIMFRMAEAPNHVLVHDSIKTLAEAQGLESLLFFSVESST